MSYKHIQDDFQQKTSFQEEVILKVNDSYYNNF